MLERFRLAKEAEILALEAMAAAGTLPGPLPAARPSLYDALKARGPGAVIAEFKRASPSLGPINTGLAPGEAAAGYARAGAAALSVLTEETFFQGCLEYLEAMTGPGLPLLRKDFLLHPLQVRQTAATPASALLLIARMLDQRGLEELLELSAGLGLEAVVEVFDRRDLEAAKTAGAAIIQVNNRNLATLGTDLRASLELIAHRSGSEVWISASGMRDARDMRQMRDAGFDGLLLGTRLMREADPGAALAGLLRQMREDGA